MQPKAKLYKFRATSSGALHASRSCLFILGVNWLTQGVRGMDAKEWSFRAALLAALGLGASTMLHAMGVPSLPALAGGLLIGHTFNFLVNGQFWVCCRYCPAYRQESAILRQRIATLLDKVAARPWLEEAVVIGSTVTRLDEPGPRSDVDLRLIFPSSALGWLRTNLLLLELRAWALVKRLPLDLYAYANPAALRRFDQSEPLGIVLDRAGRLNRDFADRQLVRLR